MEKSSSIFSFNTLKGFPWPTRAFCLVPPILAFIGSFFYVWLVPALEVYALKGLDPNDLGYYIAQQRNPQTQKNPFVLISGASYSGLGVSSQLLADRLGSWEKDRNCVVAKIALSSAYPWDTYAFLKKYQQETEHVKLVVCNLHPRDILHEGLLPGQLKWTIPSLGGIGMRHPTTGERLSTSFLLDRTQLFIRRGLAVAAKDFLYPKIRSDLLETNAHEAYWNDPEYAQNKLLMMQKWRSRSPEEIETHRNAMISIKSDPMLIQCIWDLVQYCQERNIFLVLHRTPFTANYDVYPHGYLDPKEPESLVSECEHTFFQLQNQLSQTPGVLVLDCPSFHSMGCDDEESTLFFDRVHMTRKGAEIYTNWLCDRIQKHPEVRRIIAEEQTMRAVRP